MVDVELERQCHEECREIGAWVPRVLQGRAKLCFGWQQSGSEYRSAVLRQGGGERAERVVVSPPTMDFSSRFRCKIAL